tara:strand:+ start:10810 stop:11286 length:477 start_codon:yes stop_codon:yes gene_type:complete
MRKVIRKIIKESLYNRMEKDYILRSGKVLPNFRGVMTSLTTNPSHINQTISVMEMIDSYSLYSNAGIKSKVKKIADHPKVTDYSVNLYFSDMQVAIAIYRFIQIAAEASPWSSDNFFAFFPEEDNDKFEILLFPVSEGPNKRYYNVKYYIRIPENKEQ